MGHCAQMLQRGSSIPTALFQESVIRHKIRGTTRTTQATQALMRAGEIRRDDGGSIVVDELLSAE